MADVNLCKLMVVYCVCTRVFINVCGVYGVWIQYVCVGFKSFLIHDDLSHFVSLSSEAYR